jgi:hypothetical protein
MHSLLACSAYFSEQGTFGQNSRRNLNGTKKERKTHKGQLNGRKRTKKEGKSKERKKGRKKKKERVLMQCTWIA